MTTGARVTGLGLDVVFPVLHGPFGEDGTVQGLLELANVPYVGAGVLASAVGMDKAFMKIAFTARGLPISGHRVRAQPRLAGEPGRGSWTASRRCGYPVFVKPANLGSSVGISKAKTRADLATAMDLAFEFDRKVVVEEAVPNAREIEVRVLGNDDPQASVAGEIVRRPATSSTTTRRNTWTAARTPHIPAALDEAAGGRGAAPGGGSVPRGRVRRHGARRLPARRATRAASTSTR